MLVHAELVLVIVAVTLAGVAMTSAISPRYARWPAAAAAALTAMAGLAPVLLFSLVPGERGSERALWEWSAVGGPTIQASYRLDGLAVCAIAVDALFCGAALIATRRVPSRSSLLRPALLILTFIVITAAVTDDVVAAVVVVGALSAVTTFVALLVSPAAAAARIAAYLAAGVQAFVAAALLLSRFGGGSFRFDTLAPTWISPGVILAASVGAALLAGLYPFVPWGYRTEESGERQSLRGLLTMPAGLVGAIVLIRFIGTAQIDVPALPLPGAIPSPVIAALGLFALASALPVLPRRDRGRRRFAVALALFALALFYPQLRWSHLVLAASLLTVMYAAAVSLALPEQWPVTRYDVTLATVFIAIATGSPTALAGALVMLGGTALAALAESFWMPPHRAYIATLATTTLTLTGTLIVGAGALEVRDPLTLVLAAVVTGAVIALSLIQVSRQLEIASAPNDLEVAATLFAFLFTVMVVALLAPPVLSSLADAFGRPYAHGLETSSQAVAALAALAIVLTVGARVARPFLPNLPALAARLGRVVSAADPVPLAAASFRALEGAATRTSIVFGMFEQRAGAWLALVLIAFLLTWTAR